MGDFSSWFCLGGLCITPLVIFSLGFALGRRAIGYSIRLERTGGAERGGGVFYVEQ